MIKGLKAFADAVQFRGKGGFKIAASGQLGKQ